MVTGFHHCWSSGVARRVAMPWRNHLGRDLPPPYRSIRFRSLLLAAECWGEAHSRTAARLTVSGLEGWGLVESAYRASTLLEPFITSGASPISRASTARLAVGGLQATRAGVLCGCKMQMASIYDWSAYAAGYR